MAETTVLKDVLNMTNAGMEHSVQIQEQEIQKGAVGFATCIM